MSSGFWTLLMCLYRVCDQCPFLGGFKHHLFWWCFRGIYIYIYIANLVNPTEKSVTFEKNDFSSRTRGICWNIPMLRKYFLTTGKTTKVGKVEISKTTSLQKLFTMKLFIFPYGSHLESSASVLGVEERCPRFRSTGMGLRQWNNPDP